MNKVTFEIDNCCYCPNSYKENIYTPDPFEHEEGIFCSKVQDKNSYNKQHKLVVADDWDVEKWSQIPDWCPLLHGKGCNQMKHISINVAEEIKNVLPDTLEKDLQKNEEICPVCHGLGVVINNNPYGIQGDTSEAAKKSMFPYNHQAIKFCPNCFNGVIQLCEYCGKPLPRETLKCECEQQKANDEEEKRMEYQETISKATEVGLNEINDSYLYCYENDRYYKNVDEFISDFGSQDFNSNNSEWWDVLPEALWLCDNVDISMDADSIIEDACEELHEDAISGQDRKELQELLDDWCKKQTGTTTLYPNYKKYVRVKKEWFE